MEPNSSLKDRAVISRRDTGVSITVNAEDLNVLSLKQKPDFVQTPCVQSLAERAQCYLQAGFPVHFSGPAGTSQQRTELTPRQRDILAALGVDQPPLFARLHA